MRVTASPDEQFAENSPSLNAFPSVIVLDIVTPQGRRSPPAA
jgi:hypothetical protein